VLHAVGGQNAQAAVVHAHRDLCGDLPVGVRRQPPEVVVQADGVGRSAWATLIVSSSVVSRTAGS
jgi:hypothetical protein